MVSTVLLYTLTMQNSEQATELCMVCGGPLPPGRADKRICGYECKRRRNAHMARVRYREMRALKMTDPIPCQVCQFPYSRPHFEYGNGPFNLCPNHKALITNGMATLDQVLSEWPDK